MKVISGKNRSIKTRYIIGEYIYKNIMGGREVYYLGDMWDVQIYEALRQCHSKRKGKEYGKVELLDEIGNKLNNLKIVEDIDGFLLWEYKDELFIVDKEVEKEDIIKLRRLNEVIITKKLGEKVSIDADTIVDNNKRIDYDIENWIVRV